MRRPCSGSVGRLKECLARLCVLTQHYARLFALIVIDEEEYRKKSQLAALVVDIFDAAANMERWAARQFHSSSFAVSWNDQLNPVNLDILVNGSIDRRLLPVLLGKVWAAMRATQADMMDVCLSSRELFHLATLVKSLIAGCPPIPLSSAATFPSYDFLPANKSFRAPRKRITGPRISLLDPIFSREYSLRDYAAPRRADRIDLIVPFFWTLSTREAMVCDSCLLSAIEYDGLPLQFYRDMAQQAADEARHAVMYLDLAIELMPRYLDFVSPQDKTAILIRKFLDGAAKLPVPKEGNLFSCMWHASLEERLVIMQITTEGAAVASTRQAMEYSLARTFSSVKRAFEVDYYDEVAHARIGTRWLRHIRPNAIQRKNTIEDAKLLRGFLLLTCFASRDGSSDIAALMAKYATNQVMGSRDYFV